MPRNGAIRSYDVSQTEGINLKASRWAALATGIVGITTAVLAGSDGADRR